MLYNPLMETRADKFITKVSFAFVAFYIVFFGIVAILEK